MRILVLGGTGFIGSHIVDGLLKDGHYVKVIGRTVKYKQSNFKNKIEYIQADFGDSLLMLEALTGIDIVMHLISSTVPGTSNFDPVADIQTNLVNSVRLFIAMNQANVKRIIYFSSGGTVYGNPDKTPIPEEAPKHPISPYGITKLAIENYLYMYQELHGLKPVILRVSNPYGPRQGHLGSQGVIGTFLKQVMQGLNIRIWGDGSIIRDYIYISDVVSACIAAVNSEVTGTFNIGSGEEYSLLDIVHEIEVCTGKRADIIFESKRGFDVKKVVLDISRAKDRLNWAPRYSLRDGIKLHYEWLIDSSEKA
jgi:UDP-glucose 4-epimerase